MVSTIEHESCGPIKLVSPPVKFSHSNPSIRTAPPTLGQHTDEVLTEILKMDGEEIIALKAKGVLS
jgi:succinate--hydroxymethylglutarate CoA-transferase